METSAQQILIDAFNALPSVVQQAILSSDLEDKMKDLSQKHKIHLDKWTQLENEITYALFGITAPEELTTNIEKHVGLPREQAIAINNAAVEIIFEPIRKQLQNVVTAAAAERAAPLASLDQQKASSESGVSIPTASTTQNSVLTLQHILKRRLAGDTTGIVNSPKQVNNAGDSKAAAEAVSGDPYRELAL
jgi:hypothetical protein